MPTDEQRSSAAESAAQPTINHTAMQPPLPVKVVRDEELSQFEKITLRYGRWGLIIAGLSLIAASTATYFVLKQFREMAQQTTLLSASAEQARRDSRETAITTGQQLEALQAQVGLARSSTKALQGELAELG